MKPTKDNEPLFSPQHNPLMVDIMYKDYNTMTPKTNNEWEKEFYKELVEMSPLMGRDMHNCPPLYELEFEKIDEIKSFIRSLLAQQRNDIIQEIEEALPKEKHSYSGCIAHRGLNGVGCEVCIKAKKENDKQDGYNQALLEITQAIKKVGDKK